MLHLVTRIEADAHAEHAGFREGRRAGGRQTLPRRSHRHAHAGPERARDLLEIGPQQGFTASEMHPHSPHSFECMGRLAQDVQRRVLLASSRVVAVGTPEPATVRDGQRHGKQGSGVFGRLVEASPSTILRLPHGGRGCDEPRHEPVECRAGDRGEDRRQHMAVSKRHGLFVFEVVPEERQDGGWQSREFRPFRQQWKQVLPSQPFPRCVVSVHGSGRVSGTASRNRGEH